MPQLNRRQFLQFTAAATAAGLVLPLGHAQAAETSGEVHALDLHIVTVTDTSFTVAWTTYSVGHFPYFKEQQAAPAATEVYVGPADSSAPLRLVHEDATPRAFHQVTVEGLEPGRQYRFECRSNGVVAKPNWVHTTLTDPMTSRGIVTTLQRPSGSFVQRIAIMNDTHVGLGEHLVKWTGETPYSYFLMEDNLDLVRTLAPSVLLINGDVTSEARPHECKKARQLLDAYGTLNQDYFVTAGNHDRPHRVDEDRSANYQYSAPLPADALRRSERGREYHYNFGDWFGISYQTPWTFEVGGLRIIGADSAMAGNSAGGFFNDDQLEQLRAIHAADPDRPTLSLCHHPVTDESALSAFGSRSFLLDLGDAIEFQRIQARTPGVFAHLGGHTHRGRRTPSLYAPGIEYLENPASGEFPCGVTVLDIYTDGAMISHHRPNTERYAGQLLKERWASGGVLPDYTLYRTDHRNFTFDFDFSGLVAGGGVSRVTGVREPVFNP
ncbi:metallophosphoesterase [Staphylococcus chromogenes]|nr:metallophosphoesterase [Staphylococcus chromogenes]